MVSEITSARVLITGGSGFIGATLVERLVDQNRVWVFDSFSRDALSHRSFARHPNLTIIKGDVLDPAAVQKAVEGMDYIIHCAGIAGINTVVKSPTATLRVNMIGSANVLEAALTVPNLKRLVCFSTSEVFGSHAIGAHERHEAVIGAAGEARWTYAVSKLAEEHMAIAYHQEFGLPTTVVRPFNVYGPGQVGEGALKIFVQRALRDEALEIHGDGTQIRAWCYVDDMIDGTLLSLSHPAAVGQSFNIGNQRSVETIFGLANTIIRVLNSRSEVVFVRKDYADIELRIPSVSKARDLIGFEARVGLEEGIRRTAAYYAAELCS